MFKFEYLKETIAVFILKQYQTMKWVLKWNTSLSIISDSNWENLKHNELQPNLTLCLYKKTV